MRYFFQSAIYILALTAGFVSSARAQVLGPSAMEVQFSYSTVFTTTRQAGYTAIDHANFHASHLFGIFQSQRLIRSYGVNPNKIGGIGAPRGQMAIQILSQKAAGPGKVQIQYVNRGRLLLQKNVAMQLLSMGQMTVPLPTDPYEIYDVNCTDPHYQTFGDYWYFYDPFRDGCQQLSRPPMATLVSMKITAPLRRKMDLSPRLDLLRGDNGNGSLFSIYVIHGYYESSTARRDDGRVSFQQFNTYMRKSGFQETQLYQGTTRPLHIFKKPLQLPNGKVINVEIKHLLVETGSESRNVSFAKFFREAVAQADVIYYGGHSGLGANLDIPYLESKAGRFVFPQGKKQIFFFDSCSSYSYYLDPFSAEKTRSSIDVISYGLSSYFEMAEPIMEAFFNVLLTTKANDIPWMDILTYMEKPLNGGSYLLNVGGI